MTTGGAQSNWSEGKRRSEAPEQGTIAALVALGGLVRRRGVAPERGTIVGLVALGGLGRRGPYNPCARVRQQDRIDC